MPQPFKEPAAPAQADAQPAYPGSRSVNTT